MPGLVCLCSPFGVKTSSSGFRRRTPLFRRWGTFALLRVTENPTNKQPNQKKKDVDCNLCLMNSSFGPTAAEALISPRLRAFSQMPPLPIRVTSQPCQCDSHIDCCQKISPQCAAVIDPVFISEHKQRDDQVVLRPSAAVFALFPSRLPSPGLPLTVSVRFCGIIEGSVARARGLHWGWLKALSLFA